MRLNEGGENAVIPTLWRCSRLQTNRTVSSTINGLFVEECKERSRYDNDGRNGDEKIRHRSSVHFGNDLPFKHLTQHDRNPKQEREEEGPRHLNEAKEQRAKSDWHHPINSIANEHRKRVLVRDSVLTPLLAKLSMIDEMLHLSLLLHPSLIQPFLHTAMNLLVVHHFLRHDFRDRSLRVVNVTLVRSSLRSSTLSMTTGHKKDLISGTPTSCWRFSPEESGTSPE